MRRRRGAGLEEAILDAAWAELSERGYADLTMDAVAARAGTSRPVLARRWDGRVALAGAALRRRMAEYSVDVPDRGDVRFELLEWLDLAAARADALAAAFVLLATESFRDGGGTPNDLRASLLAGEADSLAPILDRAAARGEIDANKLTGPIVGLLPDLLRQHAFTTWSGPDPHLRAAWVDTIFLPLTRTHPK